MQAQMPSGQDASVEVGAVPEWDAITVNSLQYAYPGHSPVISNFSLSLPRGSRCLLVGANGAGKFLLPWRASIAVNVPDPAWSMRHWNRYSNLGSEKGFQQQPDSSVSLHLFEVEKMSLGDTVASEVDIKGRSCSKIRVVISHKFGQDCFVESSWQAKISTKWTTKCLQEAGRSVTS